MTVFDFTYPYNDLTIASKIYTNSESPIERIILLGTAQTGKLPEWVIAKCPPNTAVVQGAPHWHARDDGEDVPDFMYKYTLAAIDTIISSFELAPPLEIIADSQAVPGAVNLFASPKYHKYLKNMSLIQPLGLTTTAYAGSEKYRMSKFHKRVILNARHHLIPLLHDFRLHYNYFMLLKVIGVKGSKVANAQYSSGLRYNSLPDLKKLHEMNPNIRIICGDKDAIFPAHEIKNSLKKAGIPIKISTIPGVPHSSLATRQGIKILMRLWEQPE